MSAGSTMDLRMLAFGDLDTGLWASAWIGPEPFIAFGSLDAGSSVSTVRVEVAGSAASEDWSLSGDGVEVTISPSSEVVASSAIEGYDQLCRAHGRLTIDGGEQAVDALGRRGSRAGVDFSRLDSLRDICAWFSAEDGIALTALRPRRAHGQAGDVVVASVFEATGAVAAADPRLSTTYAADGSPARAGLELWMDVAEGSDEQYPRRVAGEATGMSASATADGLMVTAHAFRWHSRGNDGAGVYLLARPR